MSDRDAGRGLYRKYDIVRTDGSSGPGGKHEHCEYFILDLTHDPAARTALEAYASAIAAVNPALFDDLNDKLAPHRFCTPPVEIGDMRKTRECASPAVIPLGNGVWYCVDHGVEVSRRFRRGGMTVCSLMQDALARRLAKRSAT